MQKVFTLIMSVILLISGMQISIDHHYCSGELVETKLSLTGKPASCGMEEAVHESSEQSLVGETCKLHNYKSSWQTNIEETCCEDKISFYNCTATYLPEYFKFSHPVFGKENQFFHEWSNIFKSFHISDLPSKFLPPGKKIMPDIELAEICVFQI